MDSQPKQPTIRIVVKDLHKRRNPLDPEETVVWHTLDQLEGHVIIQSAALLTFDKFDMRLEGHSRVWIKATDENYGVSSAKSSYDFLFQSHEAKEIERVEDASPEVSGYIVPFRFVIPKWALVKSVVAYQCLGLPPSISMGQTLPWYDEPEVYAQPNISYHLLSLVKYHTLDQSETQTLEARKEIRIVPVTEVLPPIDIQDFPAEFVESQTQTFRISIFGGPAYSMTLSMHEPPAIILRDMRTRGTTTAELIIDIKAAEGNIDENSVDRLSQSLRKLTFTVESIFRAKTFYSITPFAKLPGQTALTLKGPMRLQDEVMKLGTVCDKSNSWQYLPRNQRPSYAEAVRRPSSQSVKSTMSGSGDASPSNSPSPPRSWSARICVPLVVPADILPTFCSALAARQYSIITRTKISGIRTKPFILEVPMQMVYSPPEGVKASRLDAALDVEDTSEGLPGYS